MKKAAIGKSYRQQQTTQRSISSSSQRWQTLQQIWRKWQKTRQASLWRFSGGESLKQKRNEGVKAESEAAASGKTHKISAKGAIAL